MAQIRDFGRGEELVELDVSIPELVRTHYSGEEFDPEGATKPYSIRLYPSMVSRLDDVARKLRVTRGYLMRRLLESSLSSAEFEIHQIEIENAGKGAASGGGAA